MADQRKPGEQDPTEKNPKLQGEGNYVAGREYQKEQHKFAQSGKVDEAARDAARAVDSKEEGPELEKARKETGNVKPS